MLSEKYANWKILIEGNTDKINDVVDRVRLGSSTYSNIPYFNSFKFTIMILNFRSKYAFRLRKAQSSHCDDRVDN
jgi:hypothetical protein